MPINYEKPYEKERSDNDTYRDTEEEAFRAARRQGKAMDFVERDIKKAMDALYSDKPEAAPVAKKTAKKAVKKSANRK